MGTTKDSEAASASSESYAAFVENIVMDGFAALNLAVGSRLGLFEVLRTATPQSPVTSHALAQRTGFKERYLREWLAGMATAKVIDYDDSVDGFFLAPSKAQALQDSPVVDSLLAYVEILPSLGSVHEHVLACFPEDGPSGIPNSVCGGTFRWLGRMQERKYTADFFAALLNSVPGLADQLAAGIQVVDFGCGSGGAISALARKFPASSFCGLDIVEENLSEARAACKGLSNVEFQLADVCDVSPELSNRFDLVVVFDVLHDLPYPDKFLDCVRRSLRPGGCLLLNEVEAHSDLKQNLNSRHTTSLYSISLHHCLPTSLNSPGSRGLGTCGGLEAYQSILQDAGLVKVERIYPTVGGLYFVAYSPLL